jgi:hypothetical protein
LNTECDRHNTSSNSQTNSFSTVENEKLMRDIQIYEQRIQGLIDGIGMLKERVIFKKKEYFIYLIFKLINF